MSASLRSDSLVRGLNHRVATDFCGFRRTTPASVEILLVPTQFALSPTFKVLFRSGVFPYPRLPSAYPIGGPRWSVDALTVAPPLKFVAQAHTSGGAEYPFAAAHLTLEVRRQTIAIIKIQLSNELPEDFSLVGWNQRRRDS